MRWAIPNRFLYWLFIFIVIRTTAQGACRDCAQVGAGGPTVNAFTAYDSLCQGTACAVSGLPQVFVNTANLTLFVRVADLGFGGPSPSLVLERSFTSDDAHSGVFGAGWSFNLAETLTVETDGTLTLRRGSGRTDRFAPTGGPGGWFAVTATNDKLSQNTDGSYVLRSGW